MPSTTNTSDATEPLSFRIEEIARRIRADDVVLDVGCARHDAERRQRGNLHDELTKRAHSAVGTDVVEEEVSKMQESGYEVVVADAERLEELPVDREFDVVVAGELIEHLSNPGLFLDGADQVTGTAGRLILSTPNPHAFVFTKKTLLNRSNNEEHTCWFDEQFIEQLGERHGWTLVDLTYRPPQGGVSKFLWRFSRRFASPGFVAEFHKQ